MCLRLVLCISPMTELKGVVSRFSILILFAMAGDEFRKNTLSPYFYLINNIIQLYHSQLII